MQKKIIALAVAALASSAAMAQSNVTIYGIADAYVGSVKADGANLSTRTVVNSGGLSSSRLGFKGVEDLGNGLKALFVMETGVNFEMQGTTAGNSGLFGASRQAMVGLTGGFGTAVAGRLQTTGYDWAVKFGGGLAGSQLSPLHNLTTNAGLIGGTNATAARLPNAVAYISPNLSGFTAAVNYSANVNAQEGLANNPNPNTTAYMMSGTYENGPLAAGLVYAKANSPTANSDTKDWALGASYDMKVVKLGATYQTTKFDAATSPAKDTDKVWSLSASAPVTAAGTVHFQYAKNNIKSTAGADNSNGYTVAYTHGLSKRTTAYAGYSVMNNQALANVAIGNDAAAYTPANDGKSSILAAGIRHSF